MRAVSESSRTIEIVVVELCVMNREPLRSWGDNAVRRSTINSSFPVALTSSNNQTSSDLHATLLNRVFHIAILDRRSDFFNFHTS